MIIIYFLLTLVEKCHDPINKDDTDDKISDCLCEKVLNPSTPSANNPSPSPPHPSGQDHKQPATP